MRFFSALTRQSPLSYLGVSTVGICYNMFQIIVSYDQINMMPQATIATLVTSRLLLVPMVDEDRDLRSFHFSHLKHLQNFLLFAYRIVHIRVGCRQKNRATSSQLKIGTKIRSSYYSRLLLCCDPSGDHSAGR